ncbi:MAG: VCBS repeat-containing protein [Bacteroidota bacterium]
MLKQDYNKYTTYLLLVAGLFVISCQQSERKMEQFSLVDVKASGINFENTLTYTEDFNAYLFRGFYNGSGVGLGDLNRDGWLDIFFAGNQVTNELYLGNGQFEFRKVTSTAGVASSNAWVTGVSIADVNQDGWLDIYICKSGDPAGNNRRNELFINIGINAQGVPIFEEKAAAYGIDDLGFSIHAIFLDYDKDGDLDLYLSNNSVNPTDMIMDAKKGLREIVDQGGGDKLYRNDGETFTDVSLESGIYSSAIGFGLGIAAADINQDGWTDIYVANDFFEKDYLYLNNQDGTFTESITELTEELSLGSMGVDIADINNDARPDIFVTEMLPNEEGRLKTKISFENWHKYHLKIKNGYYRQFGRNVLQLNQGKNPLGVPKFSEVGRYAGVAATDWSWGVQMVDFDLDGKKDIFITNGLPKDLLDQDYIDYYFNSSYVVNKLKTEGAVIKDMMDKIPSEPLANFLYQQKKDGLFTDVATAWGLSQKGFSSGAAYGDIDNDGDMDLVVANTNARPFIYKNNSQKTANHFLGLSLKKENGSPAIGAKVTIKVKNELFYQELSPYKGAMSTSDERLVFGLGTNAQIDSLVINWPNGCQTKQYNLATNQYLVFSTPPCSVDHSFSSNDWAIHQSTTTPIFTDVTAAFKMDYRHQENTFVDFDREKLLFQTLSNEGPKIVVGDVNGDHLEDFYIGGAKGISGALFLQNDGGTGFRKSNQPVFEEDKGAEDTRSLLIDVDGDTDLDLIVGSGGYEFSENSYALLDRLYLNDGKGNFRKSNAFSTLQRPMSTAIIVEADYDKDGDLDLFVGGRLIPSKYGLPASSYLLENDGRGNFQNVSDNVAPNFKNLGLVTDAVWIDYDLDGDEDLVVVGEWMPIHLFENQEGQLEHITEQSKELRKSNGFWHSIYRTDLNRDGYEDLVVGNIGLNTFLQGTLEQPTKLYVNDFDKNGAIEQILTTYNGVEAYPIHTKKELTQQIPSLLKTFLKSADYKEKTVESIFPEQTLAESLIKEVFTNRSSILWNEKGKFKLTTMPPIAQMSPVYSILCTNLDKDGAEEILLGGNQLMAKPQTGIYAASYGVVLKQAEEKEYEQLTMEHTGFCETGQIRDLKKIMINGTAHLLVAKNNDYLKIYRINK